MKQLRTVCLRSAPVLALAALSATSAQAIVGGTSTTAFGVVGNGVQVAPNWVISAHHLGQKAGGFYGNGYGNSLIAAAYNYTNAAFPNDDVTLLRLSTAISSAPQISVSSTVFSNTSLNLLNPDLDLPVTLTTSNNQTPRGYAWGHLRDALDAFTDDPDNNPATPNTNYSVNWLLVYEDNLGAPYVQSGDSGRGLFWGHTLTNDTPLLGIASALLSQVAGVGTNTYASAYFSIAAYRAWIDATMAADLTDNQTINWVSTPYAVPEPGSAALLLAGLGALAAPLRARRLSK